MLTNYIEDVEVRPAQGAILLQRTSSGELEPASGAGNLSRNLTPLVPDTKAIVLPVADTEYFWDITGATRVEFSCRADQDIKFGFEPNITQGFDYITLIAGQQKALNFGLGVYNGNLYFSSDANNTVIELEIWTNTSTTPVDVLPQTYEAELGVLTGIASIQNNTPNASNNAAVGNLNTDGSGVTFIVNGGLGGDRLLTIRYANGTGSDRLFSVVINGARQQQTFPPTPSWTDFVDFNIVVNLNSGNNNIIQVVNRSSLGDTPAIDLDYIRI